MMKPVYLALAVFTAALFTDRPAAAQSFDCGAARQPDERVICNDRALGELDDEMVELYRRVEQSASPGGVRMLQGMQRAWLQSRHACHSDKRCIEEHYRTRIAELRTHGDESGGAGPERERRPQAPGGPGPGPGPGPDDDDERPQDDDDAPQQRDRRGYRPPRT